MLRGDRPAIVSRIVARPSSVKSSFPIVAVVLNPRQWPRSRRTRSESGCQFARDVEIQETLSVNRRDGDRYVVECVC